MGGVVDTAMARDCTGRDTAVLHSHGRVDDIGQPPRLFPLVAAQHPRKSFNSLIYIVFFVAQKLGNLFKPLSIAALRPQVTACPQSYPQEIGTKAKTLCPSMTYL
jgi:hypothetical protein